MTGNSENPGGAQRAGGNNQTAYTLQFPVDPVVWLEAKKLILDGNTRLEDIAEPLSADPALIIELLRLANASLVAGAKVAITSPKAALIRIGSKAVIDLLEKCRNRKEFADPAVRHWFEQHRSRARKVSLLANLFANSIAKKLADDCRTSALLSATGDMLAVAHLGQKYVALAEGQARSALLYRLAQDYKFDVEKMGIGYLQLQGIPDLLLQPLNRNGVQRAPERAIIRPIIQAATELVDAHENNRWEKLAPGRSLSTGSAVRLLKISDAQYLNIYEKAAELMAEIKAQEEKKKRRERHQPQQQAAGNEPQNTSEFAALHSEIQDLLSGFGEEEDAALNLLEQELSSNPTPEKK